METIAFDILSDLPVDIREMVAENCVVSYQDPCETYHVDEYLFTPHEHIRSNHK